MDAKRATLGGVVIALAAAILTSPAVGTSIHHPPTPLVEATGADGTTFTLEGGLAGRGGRRSAFQMTADPPPDPDGEMRVGGTSRRSFLPVAQKRQTSIASYLECSFGGVNYVYGTAGAGVRRVIAVAADGRRTRMRRFRVAGYAGSIVLSVLPARVGLLGIRARDARGKTLAEYRYAAPPPCTGGGFTRPQGATFDKHRPDPDIVTGAIAERLVRAERTWRRSRMTSYAFQSRVYCFCPGAPGWTRQRVRDGRPVAESTTVEDLFRMVRRDIEDRPASLKVRYNRFGVPKSIFSDHRTAVSDDEFSFAVRRFKRR